MRLAPVCSYKDGTFRTLRQHYNISLSARARAHACVCFVCGFKKNWIFLFVILKFHSEFSMCQMKYFPSGQIKIFNEQMMANGARLFVVLNIQMILMQLSFLFCHQLWIGQFFFLSLLFSSSGRHGNISIAQQFTHHFSQSAVLSVPSIVCTPLPTIFHTLTTFKWWIHLMMTPQSSWVKYNVDCLLRIANTKCYTFARRLMWWFKTEAILQTQRTKFYGAQSPEDEDQNSKSHWL